MTTMSDERTQTGFRVDKEALELAKEKAEHGELSEELRRTVNRLAYGGDKTRRDELKTRLEEKRDEKREVAQQIEALRTERNDIQREIEHIEHELDNLRDVEAEYEGMLETMESDLHDGVRVWGTMSKVEKAAEVGGKTQGEVMRDLKERNPEVPDKAFREPKAGERGNWKKKTGL